MDEEFDIEKWREKYHNLEIVDLKKYFTIEEFNKLRKLGITIKDKVYTEYEFECLNMDLLAYYKEDGMSEEELEFSKDLEGTGVSREEYNKLLEKVNKINKIHNF